MSRIFKWTGGRHLAVALAAAVAIVVVPAVQAPAAPTPTSFADLAEGLLDTVVNISSSQTVSGQRKIPLPELPEGSPFREFFEEFFDRNQEQPKTRRVNSLGSGFVIDASGIIVTNAHVIEDADEIEVNFSDGTTMPATVRGRDTKTDLAVLEVKPKDGHSLKAVPFGKSDELRVGDWVMAIGNPFGLGGSVTVGIVSARNRDINSGPYDDYIQTDAAINRGNSGGPLFDVNGNVIGINTAIISPTGGSIGIGFAVPSETAIPVIRQLREYGETRRGWLGVRIQTVTEEIAESLDLTTSGGALVAGINDDGPAALAGIEVGDVILEFDGRAIDEMRELPRIVADTEIGKTAKAVIWRKGARVELDVVIARLSEEDDETEVASVTPPQEPADETRSDILGLTLSELTEALRGKYAVADDAEGVVITAIEETGLAYEKGLREGDVIVEAGQKAINGPDDFNAVVEELQTEGRSSLLLLVRRKDGELRYMAIRLPS